MTLIVRVILLVCVSSASIAESRRLGCTLTHCDGQMTKQTVAENEKFIPDVASPFGSENGPDDEDDDDHILTKRNFGSHGGGDRFYRKNENLAYEDGYIPKERESSNKYHNSLNRKNQDERKIYLGNDNNLERGNIAVYDELYNSDRKKRDIDTRNYDLYPQITPLYADAGVNQQERDIEDIDDVLHRTKRDIDASDGDIDFGMTYFYDDDFISARKRRDVEDKVYELDRKDSDDGDDDIINNMRPIEADDNVLDGKEKDSDYSENVVDRRNTHIYDNNYDINEKKRRIEDIDDNLDEKKVFIDDYQTPAMNMRDVHDADFDLNIK